MEFDGNLVLTSQALSFLLLKIMYHTECCIFSLHIYLDRSMKSYIALSFFFIFFHSRKCQLWQEILCLSSIVCKFCHFITLAI